MARPLPLPDPENATVEELKQVCRVAPNDGAASCSATRMLLAGAHRELVCKNEEKLTARLDQAILEVIDNPERT